MEDRADSEAASLEFRSDVKNMGEKRHVYELEENQEAVSKRLKVDEINTRVIKTFSNEEVSNQCQGGEIEMSHVTEMQVTLDMGASEASSMEKQMLHSMVSPAPKPLDVNTEIIVNNLGLKVSRKCPQGSSKLSLPRKHAGKVKSCFAAQRRIGLDLNADDASNSRKQNTIASYQNYNQLKCRDASECESSTGPLQKKDAHRVWKEMKQNGFISSRGGITISDDVMASSYGGIPVPKQRGRKSKNDILKKKMELAKKEQVDRFTRIAAPSGLLNDLNPGIINHVRNKKQVHSIIEAIVRSEKTQNCHSGSKHPNIVKMGNKDIFHRKDQDNMNHSGIYPPSLSHEEETVNALPENDHTRGHLMLLNRSFPLILEEKSVDCNSVDGKSLILNQGSEDDLPALKLSASLNMPENTSSISNEESDNFLSPNSLTCKAAKVASQWLELLHQDIKGRLSALRRSKKRVKAVITTELPFLISKEFSPGELIDPNANQNVADESKAIADLHLARWTTIFSQMDIALNEEEKQLETWLSQVKEMQFHCDRGLDHISWSTSYFLHTLGLAEKDARPAKLDSSEQELAVRAAAASIYSTCSFLLSKENISCF